MRCHPILFSDEMVQAILDGRKTQTRRPLGVQPKPYWTEIAAEEQYGETIATYRAFTGKGSARWAICSCPFGAVGDTLWVRECWGLSWNDHGHQCLCYRARGEDDPRDTMRLWDGSQWRIEKTECPAAEPPEKWRPSIHMPRWASRITLEISEVRVERVCDISEEDALAEGVRVFEFAQTRYGMHEYFPQTEPTAAGAFCRRLWEPLYGSKHPWETAWCWVLKFRKL